MMSIMHPVWRLFVLLSAILLALGLRRADADGETVIRIHCDETQNVTSQNYPRNYQNNQITCWYILADPGKRIIVAFNDFRTEVVDFLSIVEENYPYAKAKYSGSKPFTPYVSLGNHLELIFRSDSSDSKTGFHLSISCLKEIGSSTIHEAYKGQEHTRVLTHPLCRDTWQTNVADTICREAGFPGSYETDFTIGSENDSRSDGISYQCDRSTFRLQDCKKSVSECTITHRSTVIKCNVLGNLGCYDLSLHTNLLERSVELSRDECVTYCKAESATPQYAAHLNRSHCSCINRTELNITELSQDRDSCGTNIKSQSRQWATLYNVSFGYCEEPPKVNKGSWKTTSKGYPFGTSISAECNDGYELVEGEEGLKCGRGTNSSSLDFEWHGSIPSCQKNSTVTSTSISPKVTSNKNVSVPTWVVIIVVVVLLLIITIVIVWVCCIKRPKNEKDEDISSLWDLPPDHTDSQRQSRERSRGRETHSSAHNRVPTTTAVENEYMSNIDTMTPSSPARSLESPTSTYHSIGSDIRTTVSMAHIQSTESSTNDSPRVLNSFQSGLRVEDMMPDDSFLSESLIDPPTSSLPLMGVHETSRSLTQPVPSTCPMRHRPLPGRPVSKDHRYAEPLNDIFPDAESSEPTVVDVSATGVRLPRTCRKPLKPAKKLFSLLPKSGTSPSGFSHVSEPRPYEEPLTTVHVSGSSDSLTSKERSFSDGLYSSSKHEYEDAETQMDRPTLCCRTSNSEDSGVCISDDDFDRRMF